mmetsp:Transcript_4396/g.8383  ORF Transcript_4396/g.8383 Transcript_4396/m.8383 type:complete len:120 (-) Transcript_4396:408-767(-)
MQELRERRPLGEGVHLQGMQAVRKSRSLEEGLHQCRLLCLQTPGTSRIELSIQQKSLNNQSEQFKRPSQNNFVPLTPASFPFNLLQLRELPFTPTVATGALLVLKNLIEDNNNDAVATA